MKCLTLTTTIALAIAVAACAPKHKEKTDLKYPHTARTDSASTFFGTTVKDPYRWLENDTSKETGNWIKEQNKVTLGFLDKIPYRDAIRKRLEKLYNYERVSIMIRKGDYYYYTRNDGLQTQNVIYRKKGENGTPEVFLDPNTFSKDGTTTFTGMNFTSKGDKVTYRISEGGSDWTKAISINTTDKKILEDTLINLKFSSVAWKGDEGFYYSSYDKPKGSILSAKTEYHKLYYHRLGTQQRQDVLIFGGEQQPRRYIRATLTEDERFLVVTASNNTTGNELYVQDLHNPRGKLIPIVSNLDNDHSIIDNDGARLIILTNLNAPNKRIVETDITNPTPEHWKDIVPETQNAMENYVSTAGGKMFISYLKDAYTLIKQVNYHGKIEREVGLPSIGNASGFIGKADDKYVYYSFTSFTYPKSVFRYDIASGKSTLYEKPKVDFNPDDYETKQIFYASKDGTKVPMFIVHKKGIVLDGKNPTWLYGYGNYSMSLTPDFNVAHILWLENGGIYAQPNIRGGGEYGEKWHVTGSKMQKQNGFDDFIAAAEYLIHEKYTSSNYLALSGRSGGGLLIGATITQRPDLARVAFPAVGILDMLRYHKFTGAAGWAQEFGTADDSKEMFDYLIKYSPVHAIKPGTVYPATLVTTADHDDRVVPAHSFKFAATLQENNTGGSPILLRVETMSGHNSTSNLNKTIAAMTDQYAFAWYNMDVLPPLAKKGM